VSAAPRVLSATAVAYLPSSLKRLSAGALAREADAPGLADALHRWGFAGASERYFQGESHQLQVVDSRTLSFRSTDGAAAFVRWVAGHASAYVGSYPARRPLAAGGRRGTLIIAQPCQCHLANPAFLGVVSAGRTVSWLEINGPRATPATLVRLLARAP
jgi:hypothetical protein